MRQILLLAAIAFATIPNSFGQGTVVFQNTASPAYNLYTNNASGTAPGLISGAGRYRIGLYASTDLQAQSLQLVGLATNLALAGKFSGGDQFALPDGFPTGADICFQLRVWSFGAGLSYEEAAWNVDPLNVALGVSPLGTTTLGGGTVLAGALFGTSAGNLTAGFELKPVPEPSTIALGLLGLGALALFRRRK